MSKIKAFFALIAPLLTLLMIFNSIHPVYCCTTPVFRYALERWPAYLYPVEIIHSGTLNQEQKKAIDLLKYPGENNHMANLQVT